MTDSALPLPTRTPLTRAPLRRHGAPGAINPRATPHATQPRDPAAGTRPPMALATPFRPSRRAGGLLLVGGLHLLAVWGLMQMGRVHEVLREVAPVMVSLIHTPAATPAAPPPLPAPPRPARPDPAPLLPPPPVVVQTAPAAPPPQAVQAVVDPTPAIQVAPAPAAATATAAPSPVATPAPAVAAAGPRMLPSSAVQYLVPPVVEYPRASRRLNETGRVVVRVLITETGLPDRLAIERSSGFARLDEAALAAVRKARFRPYVENGQPQSGWALVPLSFDLDP